MPFGRSDTKRQEKPQARDDKDHARKLAAFMDSSPGLALQARRDNDGFSWPSWIWSRLGFVGVGGWRPGRCATRREQRAWSAAIEAVGWHLEHANWVFIETGSIAGPSVRQPVSGGPGPRPGYRTVLDHCRHRVRPVADGALGRWDVLAVQRGPLEASGA